MAGLKTLGLIAATASISVAGFATASAAPGLPPAVRTGPAAVARLGAELQRLTGHSTRMTVRHETGNVTFIGATSARPLQPGDGVNDDPGETARRFVNRYAAMFGVADPRSELTQSAVFTGPSGDAVRFQQRVQGVPVLAGEIAVQIDHTGAVVSSTGEASPRLSVDVQPTVSAENATATALAITERADHAQAADLTASTPETYVYDPVLIGAVDRLGPRLVWRIEVRTALGDVDRLVLVDAHTGSVALHFTQVEAAKHRDVCDNANNPSLAETCNSPVIFDGGAGYVVAGIDAKDAYDFAGQTYDFFANTLGRDSLDGNGLFLHSTVRYCPAPSACPYNNAFWNGQQMVYGQGYSVADDVVGHELTHGVTDYTARLLYYADSGAINESISDVMGEFIDQQTLDPADAQWRLGEDLSGGALRSMMDPHSSASGSFPGDPDRVTDNRFVTSLSDNRGVHTNSGVNNKAAYLLAQSTTPMVTFNGQTITSLGITKTAKIYYQAETTLLGPGSDYTDLFGALPQACTNLITAPGSTIVANDCVQVTKAVLATEMNLHPADPSYVRTAPECNTGIRLGTQFADNTSAANGTWAGNTTGGGAPWVYLNDPSGTGGRVLHVEDKASPRGTSTLTDTVPVAVPTVGTPYLRFDHSYSTDFDNGGIYDGGIIEYTADNGASWNDLGPLAVNNGYDGSIADFTSGGLKNPLFPHGVFGSISPNYQTTRVDLSSLAGRTIRIRFVFGTDNFPEASFDGWSIDDVSVYNCGVPPPPPDFIPLIPARLLDTRSAQTTVDGQFNGLGSRSAGSVTAVTVAGRGGVAGDAVAVALNVTVTETQSAGFLTVYPCGGDPPTASNLNYGAGSTIPNAVVSKVGANGQICFFTQSALHLVVDANGFFPQTTTLVPLVPARLLDSRAGQPTVDGQSSGLGQRPSSSVTEVQVTGRAGIPADSSAAVLNVTVTEAQSPGFATVYPCGSNPPTASNLNYVGGSTIPNAVVSKVGANGRVCVFTQSPIQLVIDVNGYFPATTNLVSLVPARVLETRSGYSTIDSQSNGIGLRNAGTTTPVQITGRAGVPANATAVVVNVTVTEAQGAGFATVYPCGGAPPTASNLNYVSGSTIANAVLTKIGANGTVCVFTQTATHVIADVSGYFTS